MASATASLPTDATTAGPPARLPVALLGLLLAAAVVRLGLWWWFQGVPIHIVDEADYSTLGINLARSGRFAFYPDALTSLRPPLYPALVAGVYAVLGEESFQAVRLVQVILSLGNVLLLYGLGVEIASRRLGLWAAGLYAFYPTLLVYNNLVLTEVLFTLLLCAACYALVRAYHRDAPLWLAAAGLLLGLGALARSILWLFPVVLVPYLLATWKGGAARRLGAVALLVVPFAVPIVPWAVRCSHLERTFIAIDVMSGRNLMLGNYRYTPLYRSWDAIALEGEQSWIHEVLTTSTPQERGTQGKIDKLAMKRGLAFVLENPGLTLRRDVVKFFDFWGLEREVIAGAARGNFGPVSWPVLAVLTVVVSASYALALFLGIFGVLLAPVADWRVHGFFLLLVAFVCGLHTLAFAHSRYHLPLIPIVLVYAARTILERRSIWARRKTALFWVAAAVCVVLVAGWAWLFVAVDLHLYEKVLS
jgi:4-amino-4-deoxy-L-arabinose transferase-like glycosyltransferase